MLLNLKVHKKIDFAYHLTKKSNMDNIIKNGLIPQCGINCKKIGDSSTGIFFVSSVEGLYDFWMNELYKEEDINTLIILRFNIKNKKIIQLHPAIKLSSGKWYPGEWIAVKKVKPKEIEYLATPNEEENKIWLPIKQYQIHK